jgi:hypothetical protein
MVQARRNRFAAGAKSPPSPKFEEVELDVQDLLSSKLPNFLMARQRVLEFIRANPGTAEDVRGRELLRQIDGLVDSYLQRTLPELRKAWTENRQAAEAALDRLERECGKDEFQEKVREFRSELAKGP